MNWDRDKKSCFLNLVKIIHYHGEHFPKKHGEWIRLQLNDNWFFEMDSWSNAIQLKQGTGEYSQNNQHGYWCGFTGQKWEYIGMTFGGMSTNLSVNQIIAYTNRAKNWLNYQYDLKRRREIFAKYGGDTGVLFEKFTLFGQNVST